MNNRKEILLNILNMNGDLYNNINLLNEFEWDSGESIATLKTNNIINILEKYIQGVFKEDIIEQWANAIEGRDDIDIEEINEEIISDILFELANPILTNKLDINRANKIIIELNRS